MLGAKWKTLIVDLWFKFVFCFLISKSKQRFEQKDMHKVKNKNSDALAMQMWREKFFLQRSESPLAKKEPEVDS